jgi:hypothetical protein
MNKFNFDYCALLNIFVLFDIAKWHKFKYFSFYRPGQPGLKGPKGKD